jgi:GNAT superfamily N-acetyltransferase
MDQHLAVRAILDGTVPGKVLVDRRVRPQAALAWRTHRFYLAGSPNDDGFAQTIGRLFTETIYPGALDAGDEMLVLYYAPDGWQDRIDDLLPGKLPIQAPRQFYALREPKHDWRDLLPDGFRLELVDGTLLEQRHLKNLDALVDEVCSERPSVEDFLEQSFGVCAVHGDELAGWCLSEYNSGNRCEVGIETLAPFRRRGLGTAMVSALMEHALGKGVDRVGWHCYANNVPSVATALRAGFAKQSDYAVYMAWFDETTNLAVHGNVCVREGEYENALEWYERAFARGEASDWAYWGAACAAARLELFDSALRYLGDAIDRGFRDVDHMRASDHLTSLHDTPGWAELVARLDAVAREGVSDAGH